MELIRECFLLLSFLAIAQFAQGIDNFPVANQLMDLYGRNGPLSTIQWNAFRLFENEWKKTSLDPRVKPATANKLNGFFNKMDIAQDNYHRAMDSMVSKCAASKKTLPRLQTRKDLSAANKEMTRFMNAFGESRTHLDALKFDLESAVEYLNMVDPLNELSGAEKRFVISDFDNGTVTLEAEGEVYDNPETLHQLLSTLSSYTLNPRNPVVTLDDFHTDSAVYAPGYPAQKNLKPSSSSAGKRFVISDFDNGTVTLKAEGDLYDHPETLQRLLNTLSSHDLSSRNPLVTLYDFHSESAVSAPRYPTRKGSNPSAYSARVGNYNLPSRSAPKGPAQMGSNPSAFFARVENVKNQVNAILNKVDSATATLGEKVDNYIENAELPSDEDLEALRRKCEIYHPV